jgi:hypothetical protein
VDPTALLGTWALTRVVQDHRAGERRDVTGEATLVAESADRVRWSERGTMTWPGHEVPVERTLYVDREGDAWTVRFGDGRPFHPWALGVEVDHPCAPDHYRGRVEVTDGPDGVEAWTVTWDASGPEKDYRMVTVHTDRR